MSQALYRKYRSRSLDELVGQEHVTDVLKRAIKTGQLSHAYLLTGPRGVGKTSIARILAHEINGLPYTDDSTDLDIIEIDAASNRRIDDIRDLRERVHIAPSRSKYKVYIIDEVHMLTGESFNALLKTLEEPPEHVVFILATTELDKLPATITSRAQTFHFRRIPNDVVVTHLRGIADKEGITIDDEALAVIAAHSDGSLRDAETALDQVRHSDGPVTQQAAESILGSLSSERVAALLDHVKNHNPAEVAATLAAFEAEGASAAAITRSLASFITTAQPSIEMLNLLDALLDVPKSYSPSMKLFAVLMRASSGASRTGSPSIAAPAPVIREPIAQPSRPIQPTPAASIPHDKPAQTPSSSEESSEPVIAAIPVPTKSKPFEWDSLIEHVKKHFIVLHSVLSKCQYNFDGDTLTLYCKFKLHKTKLEDAKYRTMLNEALQGLTGTTPEVTFIFGQKPITDEGLASVAALMGGGVEYDGKLEEEAHVG